MKGTNRVIFCQSELNAVVQHYFDTVLFQKGEAPTVSGVTYQGTTSTFNVKCVSKDEDKGAT